VGNVEQRAYARRPFTVVAEAFESGARFPCKPTNLGLGGAFLETGKRTSMFRKGMIISLAFGSEAGARSAVYLFGEIVRVQTSPRAGIGVRWIKAVSRGDRDQLALFLARLLGVSPIDLRKKVLTDQGQFDCVLPFDSFHKAAVRIRENMKRQYHAAQKAEADKRASSVPTRSGGPIGLATTLDEVDSLGVDLSLTESLRQRQEAGFIKLSQKVKAKGTLTEEERSFYEAAKRDKAAVPESRVHDKRVPVTLKAQIQVLKTLAQGQIRELGFRSAIISSNFQPREQEETVRLRFGIPSKGGEHSVTIKCSIAAVLPASSPYGAGLELVFKALDEGGNRGILKQFVAWLHTQNAPRR
jgi:hypothetical protein